jgi:hypothetical protein
VGRPYPVAASSAVELALVGPRRPLSVVASTPQATYVILGNPDRTVICIATTEAVRVPCAVVVEGKSPPAPAAAGTIGSVGGGVLAVGDATYRVSRWWRPPRPRGLGAVPPARLASAVRWLTGRVADPLDAAGSAAVADLVHALRSGESPAPAVAQLLGRGPGLTPTGDDVLAGTLVGLNALGAPAARTLGSAVTGAAPTATTTVSAALLGHAARGECIPQLADLVEAIGTGVVDPAGGALPRAAGALLAVGHCSGAGLLHGVLVVLAIAHSRLSYGVMALQRVVAA